MKKILILMLLLCGINAAAQDNTAAQNLPELQEWWRAPDDWKGLGRNGASFLPNFYDGKGCLAVSLLNGNVVTWRNRFPGDTANVFSWQGGNPILTADFNGDGITDYIDGGGHVYKGLQNGQPPENVPVVKTASTAGAIIADINHDGFDDMLRALIDFNSLEITFGNKDLSNLERKVISKDLFDIDSNYYYPKAYIKSDGNVYMIFRYFTSDIPFRDGFALYQLQWEKTSTDPKITKKADYIFDAPGGFAVNKRNFMTSLSLYKSKHHNNVYAWLYNGESTKMMLYDITNDNFIKVNELNLATETMSPLRLEYSIDDDNIEDIAIYDRKVGYSFYSGKSLPKLQLLTQYRSLCTWTDINKKAEGQLLSVINDINGDSINDMVFGGTYYFDVPNCFRIVLGLNGTSAVEDRLYNIENNVFPHPIKNNDKVTLDVTIPTADTYSLRLYDVQGNYKQTLSQFFAEKGNSQCSFIIAGYPAGEYIVVLQSLQEKIISSFKIILE